MCKRKGEGIKAAVLVCTMAKLQKKRGEASKDLIVWRAAERVRDGAVVELSRVARTIASATQQLKDREVKLVERVAGGTIIFGPLRGHACDFANILLTKVLPNQHVKNIVFLGNYIDGAHQSLEVLFLVAALIVCSRFHITPLIGKHEMMYPIQPENFGSLRNEMLLCCARSPQTSLEDCENVMKKFFAILPIACVVENKYFCVAGGPASGFRTLEDMEGKRVTQDSLKEFVLNEPMDEDEERIADGSAFVASQSNELAFRYTFNAACNFLSRNRLCMLIVGMEYHTSRPDYESFARPNHFKESIYFPGYMLGRIHPDTQVPAVLTIFSAPSFCGVNRNNACIVEIADRRLEVQELGVYTKRPLVTPGTQNHAFSWAQPMLERAVVAIAREIIFGAIKEENARGADARQKRLEEIAVSKMRRMCQLLQAHDLPLPEVPKVPADE
jgi:serine/threonine-protein phosphatase 2B catalytic subunit